MKRSPFAGLLSAAILVSTAVPSLSEALSSNPMPDGRSIVRVMALYDGAESEALLVAQADFADDGRDVGPPDEIAPPDHRPGHRHGAFGPALHLAARLAAAETYIGVTSAQLDAWRTYAATLIDLVDRPTFDREPDGPRRERPDGLPPAEGSPRQPADAPLFTERLADRAIERGEKANALKAAAAALRTALAPEQIAKLRDAERSFLPPPGRPGDGAADHDRRHGDLPLPPLLPPPSGE